MATKANSAKERRKRSNRERVVKKRARGGDILILSRSRALDRIVLVGQVVRMIVCQTTQIKAVREVGGAGMPIRTDGFKVFR